MEEVKYYNVRLDSKKRFLLHGAEYETYNVHILNTGYILLEPRISTDSETISERTLSDMDNAIANFKLNAISDAIDLSEV